MRTRLARCFAIGSLVVAACAPTAPGREITVAMTEYAFVPAVIDIAPGERVRLVVRNIGRLEHDFMPEQRGIALGLPHVHLAPNASQSADWTAPNEPADVRIFCSVPGHEALGMTAHLIVRAR